MRPDLQSCLAFINCQMQPAAAPSLPHNGRPAWRVVTISRQSGAGAHVVAEKLAGFLQATSKCTTRPWAMFDQNLVDAVLEDHRLPGRLAKFMPEDRVSEIEDALDDLFGLHPPTETLIRKTAETILHLAELGNVILIGRGANIITGKMPGVCHLRLIAPLNRRVEYISQLRGIGKKGAMEFIRREDRGRRRYLKKYFGHDIDDPLLYHVVINTDRLGHEGAATMIGRMMLAGDLPHSVFPPAGK